MASFRNIMPIRSSWYSLSFWFDAASMTRALLQQLFFVGGDQVLLRGTSNMPSTSWRAFRDLGSTTWGWEHFAFFRNNDGYWIALLVLVSRVPQSEDVLLLRLPDRAALARARPQYLQDAYQHFFAKERVTLSQIDSILRLQNFHDLRESVTHDTSPAAGFVMYSVSIHRTVLPK